MHREPMPEVDRLCREAYHASKVVLVKSGSPRVASIPAGDYLAPMPVEAPCSDADAHREVAE